MTKPKAKNISNNPNEEFLQICTDKVIEKMKTQIKILCDKFLEELKVSYQEETDALRAQIVELKQRHEFICAQYEDIRTDYEKLKFKTTEQEKKLEKLNSKNTDLEKELETMKKNLTNLEEKTYAKAAKLDSLEQYNRRRNLEFEGIPISKNEDVADKVAKISKLIDVNMNKNEYQQRTVCPQNAILKLMTHSP